ncbi:deoxyribose-phosphate aldolase [Evtepia sp.]|uniref:deoxyribose-phosphate aldolase n=1 Tax=Evtepia sp. TaxID=2773933 RepID=UPI0039C5DEF1
MTMDISNILSHVDHTLLKPEATWDQIKTLCDEAMEFGCATVCIPPAYVKPAADYVQGNLKLCTVIGFPNGYNTMASKIFETKDAVENGASEIDMVINVGLVKDRKWKELTEEIAGVKAACLGRPLKVIIETCLLTDLEKVKLCQVVEKAGADYLKTSTGFGSGGATREDVALLRENLASHIKLKASGGIRTLEDGQAYLDLGADRLGASALVGEARKIQG